MRKLLTILGLLFPALAAAQGVPYHDIALYNSGGFTRIIPNPSVSVCTGIVVAIPCSPAASIFADPALTSPLPNPMTGDANGNFIFYAAAGPYIVVINSPGSGIPAYAYPFQTSAGSLLPNFPFSSLSPPTFPIGSNASFSTTLTQNVTSSTTSGTSANGTLISFTLVQDAVGGHTFSFPPQFVLPVGYSFDTVPLHTNALTFKNIDGTNFQLISNSSSGGILNVISAPVGSCTGGATPQMVISTGIIYTCQSGTWGSFATNIQTNGSATAANNPLNFTDSSTIAWSNPSLANISAAIKSASIGVGLLSATGTPSSTTFLRGDNTWATPAGGGSGCTVGGSANAIQINNGSGGCTATNNTADNGSALIVLEDFQAYGPSVPTNALLFNVRPMNMASVTKAGSAVCVNGNTSIAISSITGASGFQNGDGITFPGCGAAISMSTPTITSVNAVHPADALNTGHIVTDGSGATSYCFKVAARDTAWGTTASSAQVCTTTGPTSLGQQSASITSCSRTNATTTCTTSGNIGFTTGSRIYQSGTSQDTQGFGGFFAQVTVIDSTHYSFVGGMDSRVGGPTTSTGGTVFWENGIQLVLPSTASGVYEYLVFETSPSAAYLGMTLPTSLENGYNDPSYLTFTYWGSTLSTANTAPYWAPSSPPSSATNDNLSTTIVSGANGSTNTTIVVAVAPSIGITSTGVFDDTPTLLAAKTHVDANGGSLLLPTNGIPTYGGQAGYVFNSFLNLGNTDLEFAAPMVLNDTLKTNAKIRGNTYPNALQCSTPQFALSCQMPINVGNAYPGIWTTSGQVQGATIKTSFDGYLEVLDTNVNSARYQDVNFSGGDSNDYTGTLYIAWGSSGGAFGGVYDRISTNTGPAQSNGNSTALAMWFKNQDELQLRYFSMNRRGVGFQIPDFGLNGTFDQGQEIQGPTMPVVSFLRNRSGTPVAQFNLKNFTLDTGQSALTANWASVGTPSISIYLENVTSVPAIFTGLPFSSANVNGFATSGSGGQNINGEARGGAPLVAIDGIFSNGGSQGATFSPNFLSKLTQLNQSYGLFTDIPTPAAPTCVVQPGGTLTVGTLSITFHPVFYNGTSTGGEGRSSLACSVTTTSGNQSVLVTNLNVFGAIGYDVYIGGFQASANGTCTPPQIASFPFTLTGGNCGVSEPGTSGSGPISLLGNILTGTITASQNFKIRPSATAPAADVGINLFDLASDNWPAFNAFSNATKNFVMGFPSTGTWSPGLCAVAQSGLYQFALQACSTGSVSTFSAGNLNPLFTTLVTTPTSTPVLSFILSNALANTVFGNCTNGTAAPSYCSIVNAMLPGSGTATINGQTVTLGGTPANVNPGNSAHTAALNEGNGVAIGASNTPSSGLCFMGNGASTDPSFQTCPSGGIPTNIMTTLGDMLIENAVPTAARLAGPTAPTGVVQMLTDTPTGGAASLEAWALAGVPVNNNGETTCATQTLNVLDRATSIFCSGGSTATFTFPVHTTAGFGSNFPFLVVNNNSGKMTLTPTTDTIDNANLFSGWADFLYNNASGNWQTVELPQIGLFPGCTGSAAALQFTAATGQFSCGTITTAGLTLQTNTVNNTSQTTLNLLNSAATNGITLTVTNTSAGNVQLGYTGTLTNAGLTNSATTVNGTTCTLGSTCTPLPNIFSSKDVVAQAANESAIVLASSPPQGQYLIMYYANVNSECPSGANGVFWSFNWVDDSGASRQVQTGIMPIGTSQQNNHYLSGNIFVRTGGSSNITYQTNFTGACSSGSASYDSHLIVQRLK